jgi:hypothetical protein
MQIRQLVIHCLLNGPIKVRLTPLQKTIRSMRDLRNSNATLSTLPCYYPSLTLYTKIRPRLRRSTLRWYRNLWRSLTMSSSLWQGCYHSWEGQWKLPAMSRTSHPLWVQRWSLSWGCSCARLAIGGNRFSYWQLPRSTLTLWWRGKRTLAAQNSIYRSLS